MIANKIDARIVSDEYTNNYLSIFIDDLPLDIFLSDLTKEKGYKGLVPAWSSLDNKNEQEYVWEMLKQKNVGGLALPILLCPDDLDFSCTVIVSKVFHTEELVTWDKIGAVIKDNWNITEWRKSGIRNFGLWTEDDWGKYGDCFDLFDLWDARWEAWISENWNDEEKRRLRNYVHQYFNTQDNVKWFDNIPKLVFKYEDYKNCVEKFQEQLG